MIELLILIYLFTGLLLCGPSVKYYRSASDKAIIILISMFLWLPILVWAIYEMWRSEYESN